MYTPHRALHDGRQVFLAPAGACQFGQGAGGFKTNLISSFTRGLSVALGGKTPKKLGWAPRVRTAKPITRQKRAGYAIRMPGRTRGHGMRGIAPHAAELAFYLRGCLAAGNGPSFASPRRCPVAPKFTKFAQWGSV